MAGLKPLHYETHTKMWCYVNEACDGATRGNRCSWKEASGADCDVSEACGLDLATLTSPYSDRTTGGSHLHTLSCGSGKANNEVVFMMDVPTNGIFAIRQTTNDYDSMHETRWGGDCPGDNVVACTDDADETQHTLTNDQGRTERVYFIVDAYSGAGEFTIEWSLAMDPCAGVECGEHGSCADGSCACRDGYTGDACESAPDPCAGVQCGPHGSCANGSCVCTDGYTGASCENAPEKHTRSTVDGDECQQVWKLTNYDEQCTDYCCNPDGDDGGEWCFIVDGETDGAWGYCASETACVPQCERRVMEPNKGERSAGDKCDGEPDGCGGQCRCEETCEWGTVGRCRHHNSNNVTCPAGTVLSANAETSWGCCEGCPGGASACDGGCRCACATPILTCEVPEVSCRVRVAGLRDTIEWNGVVGSVVYDSDTPSGYYAVMTDSGRLLIVPPQNLRLNPVSARARVTEDGEECLKSWQHDGVSCSHYCTTDGGRREWCLTTQGGGDWGFCKQNQIPGSPDWTFRMATGLCVSCNGCDSCDGPWCCCPSHTLPTQDGEEPYCVSI